VRSGWELETLLDTFPFDFIPPDYNDKPFTEHIKSIIGSAMMKREPIPDIRQISRAFSLSYATFRRRLADEGTSYNSIRENARQELASQLLQRSELTIQEVSERVGFMNPRTFSRMFNRWHGMAPSRYRIAFRSQ